MLGNSQSLFNSVKSWAMRAVVVGSPMLALRILAVCFSCLPEQDFVAFDGAGVGATVLSSFAFLVHLLDGLSASLALLAVEFLKFWSIEKL